MRGHERWLLTGGVLTGLAVLLHVAIILGGPDWYRFFGAGERMARLAASESAAPAMITAAIAATLAVWTLYALSGARLIRRLPFLRLVLVLIAAVYLLRGVLGIPLVLLVDDPYTRQLQAKMTFMVVSSAICIGLGLCYAIGAAGVGGRASLDRKTPPQAVAYDDLREQMASALEAAADAQDAGNFAGIAAGHDYDELDRCLPRNDDPRFVKLHIALEFLDSWTDSYNHGWLFYEPLSAGDWPVLARGVAQRLRADAEIVDPLILEYFDCDRSAPSVWGRSATSIKSPPPV